MRPCTFRYFFLTEPKSDILSAFRFARETSLLCFYSFLTVEDISSEDLSS